jgi:cyclin-dependent kinase 9
MKTSTSDQPIQYTNPVVTLWYRPPEVLLGVRDYGTGVDMWATGCILAEMWTRLPIMQGSSDQHQLTLCTQLCGSLSVRDWPGLEKLDLFKNTVLPLDQKRKVKERLLPYVKDSCAVDLIDQLLVLNPENRINADNALQHDFFWTDPMPCDLGKMLSQLTQSNFEFIVPSRCSNQKPDDSFRDRTY